MIADSIIVVVVVVSGGAAAATFFIEKKNVCFRLPNRTAIYSIEYNVARLLVRCVCV